MRENITDFVPLSPAALHILLSLAEEDRHGYAIMQEVARQSDGQFKLGPGTLYDNLQRLTGQKLVQALGQRAGDEDPRRRYYRLSPLGQAVLSAEISRLEAIVREGRSLLQAWKPRRT